MRSKVLFALFLLSCTVEPEGSYDFESGTGGSGRAVPAYEDRLDLPLVTFEKPDRLDLPPHDPDADSKCDSLDMLFVVDNSGSMSEEQELLIQSIPEFIEQLIGFGIGFDLHVGVVSTDQYKWNPPECQSMGALVTQTEMGECGPFMTGYRFMDDSDLEDSFSCAFLVGEDGNGSEQILEAMIEALKPSFSVEPDPFRRRPDDCNLGFHRPGAGLVVVLISDEDDTSSNGTPLWWADALYALHEGEMLIVGLTPRGSCGDGKNSATIREFLDLVPSYHASICTEDMAAVLAEATQDIVVECNAVPPEG